MSTISSILSLQHSDHISKESYKDGKSLKSLWLSIPAYCHLNCPYCFASTGSSEKKVEKLSYEQYKTIITDFAKLGGEFIGIPGDGEPFHPSNWNLVKFILSLCDELKIKVALFTTGDLIFFDVNGTQAKPNYEKIDSIKDKNVVLLIKYNHSDESIQNKLVGGKHPNYTNLREKALDILINQYHLNDQKRLGLVTSIMRENSEKEESNGKLEIINIFERTQSQNLIFDCDTILELGRGKTFATCDNGVLPQVDLEKVFKKLTKAGAIGLNQGGTYVGNTCCDRILHHLYITSKGDVFPCIGCTRDDLCNKMILGNVKSNSLKETWEHPMRRKLAENRAETLMGVCAYCENFKTEKCYSCLGRCIITKEHGTPFNNDLINTIGCIHHKPSTIVWLAKLVDYIRTVLSYSITKDSLNDIRVGLEFLWRPNKNIAFTLCQLTLDERIKEINNLIEHTCNPHDDYNYKPYHKIRNSRIADFSQRKHFRFSDLQFPMNKVWDFVKDPEEHFMPKKMFDKISNEDKQKVIKIISQSFLSNVFLSSFKILLDKYDFTEQNLVYCNFILYDNIKEKYFYRSISQGNDNGDDKSEVVISRWYEDILIDGKTENPWKERCHNLSATLRHEIYGDYELKLKRNSNETNEDPDLLQRTVDLSEILEIQEIESKVNAFCQFIRNKEFEKHYDTVKDFINTRIFTELDEADSKTLKNFYAIVNNNAFFDSSYDYSITNSILDKIQLAFDNLHNTLKNSERDVSIIKKLEEDLSTVLSEGNGWKFVNYFVYLGIMRNLLGVNYYYLLHSTNFVNINPERKELTLDSDLSGIIKPSGILVCTRTPVNHFFRSELKLFISSIFAPFDEFYFNLRIQDVKLYDEVQWYQHSLDNIYSKYSNNFHLLKQSIEEKRNKSILDDFNTTLICYKIYDISRCGISKKYDHLKNYFNELISVNSIVFFLIEYFKDHEVKVENTENVIISLNKYSYFQKLLIFTIFFNLLNNAVKFPQGGKVDVAFSSNNGKFIIEIKNLSKIDDSFLNYVNGVIQRYPTGEKHRGLVIITKAVKIINWSVKASINNEETIINLTLNQ